MDGRLVVVRYDSHILVTNRVYLAILNFGKNVQNISSIGMDSRRASG